MVGLCTSRYSIKRGSHMQAAYIPGGQLMYSPRSSLVQSVSIKLSRVIFLPVDFAETQLWKITIFRMRHLVNFVATRSVLSMDTSWCHDVTAVCWSSAEIPLHRPHARQPETSDWQKEAGGGVASQRNESDGRSRWRVPEASNKRHKQATTTRRTYNAPTPARAIARIGNLLSGPIDDYR